MAGTLKHHADTTAWSGAGFLARLRGWLDARQKSFGATFHPVPANVFSAEDIVQRSTGRLLAFPIKSEALLVRLAHVLQGRFAGKGPAGDPLTFAISREPVPRMTIDRAAYVEVRNNERAFRLAIEAASDTTVSLETTDFDVVVSLIMRYIGEKLSGAGSFGAAS